MRRVARRAASSSAAVVVRQSVGGVLSTVEATASADGRSSDTLRIAHPNTVDDAAAAKGSAGASSLRQRSGSGGGALAESKRQLLSVFFPADYPSSVNGDYASFVGWQAVHHCASAANGVLASASLLCVKYIFFTLSMPEFSLYFNDIYLLLLFFVRQIRRRSWCGCNSNGGCCELGVEGWVGSAWDAALRSRHRAAL